MRILHLITHFDLGGAERVAANIAASTSEGMEYHVAEILRGRSDYTPKFLSELRAAGVKCHRSWIPDISWHFLVERIAALLFPLRMLYIMLRLRPDVIHTHTETPRPRSVRVRQTHAVALSPYTHSAHHTQYEALDRTATHSPLGGTYVHKASV